MAEASDSGGESSQAIICVHWEWHRWHKPQLAVLCLGMGNQHLQSRQTGLWVLFVVIHPDWGSLERIPLLVCLNCHSSRDTRVLQPRTQTDSTNLVITNLDLFYINQSFCNSVSKPSILKKKTCLSKLKHLYYQELKKKCWYSTQQWTFIQALKLWSNFHPGRRAVLTVLLLGCAVSMNEQEAMRRRPRAMCAVC